MKHAWITLLLMGCATQPQQNIYEMSADDCRSYGFKPGTPDFGNCMQREVAQRKDIIMRMMYGR